MKPLLKITEPFYFKKIIKYHGYTIFNDENKSDQQFYIDPFVEYNFLLDINQIFSNSPKGDIVDRTSSVATPFKFSNPIPWKSITFDKILDLETCYYNRVNFYNEKNQKLNLFWSGGIDSTAMIVAFLKYSKSYSNLKIYYTVPSIKENPSFYLFLKKIQNLEMIDYAGDEYFLSLDGITISGNNSDDITASLDESFFAKHNYVGLHSKWQDLFYNFLPNPDFIDFCSQWFKLSGLDIKTVLEARWYFYACVKYYHCTNLASITGEKFESFYATREFELYWGQNIHSLIKKDGYHTYKQNIKDFIFSYHKDFIFKTEKTKTNSSHILLFRMKKNILLDKRFIAILEDGTRITTDNMPFLNEKEYRNKYGDSLNYLFTIG